MKRGKRGVSPVVATVLLVLIVIILALIIFMWARGFVKERVVKFGEDASIVCERVNFEIDAYDEGNIKIDVVNTGNVPIYGLSIKLESEGETDVREVDDLNIMAGASGNVSVQNEIGADSVVVNPRILGTTSSEDAQPYTCDTVSKEASVGA